MGVKGLTKLVVDNKAKCGTKLSTGRAHRASSSR